MLSLQEYLERIQKLATPMQMSISLQVHYSMRLASTSQNISTTNNSYSIAVTVSTLPSPATVVITPIDNTNDPFTEADIKALLAFELQILVDFSRQADQNRFLFNIVD